MESGKVRTSYVTVLVTSLGRVAACMKVETLLPAAVELDWTCHDTYFKWLVNFYIIMLF